MAKGATATNSSASKYDNKSLSLNLLLLMKVKEESKNVGLKPNIQKTKIIPSDPVTSWQIDGETVETETDFILGAPQSL